MPRLWTTWDGSCAAGDLIANFPIENAFRSGRKSSETFDHERDDPRAVAYGDPVTDLATRPTHRNEARGRSRRARSRPHRLETAGNDGIELARASDERKIA
jgi:hypothetical protein